MKPKRIPPEKALGRCAWCGKAIPDDVEVFGVDGKLRPGVDLSAFEGAGVRIALASCNKNLIAIVPAADSDARRVGKEILFMTCSEACGFALKSAVQQDLALGEMLMGLNEPME
jgi:hypothetical protein